MLKVFNDFERDPALLVQFDAVANCYSASCVFADVQYRQNVMDCEIKPAFRAKVVGQALKMGRPGDIIVVDAGGDRQTSVCGGLMGGLAKNRGIRAMVIDGAGRDI